MVVVLGFCPSLGVPLGDRLSSGDMALDVVEISIVLFVRSWFERLALLARRRRPLSFIMSSGWFSLFTSFRQSLGGSSWSTRPSTAFIF